MSLSAESKAAAVAAMDRFIEATGLREMAPLKAIAFVAAMDALNAILVEIAEMVPRQAIADYVQAWASILADQDAAEARMRS